MKYRLLFLLFPLFALSCNPGPDGFSHLYGARSGDTFVLIDNTGTVRLKTDYAFVSSRYMDGLAYFRDKNGQYGFINLKGEEIISAQFEKTGYFNAGVTQISIEKKYGVIDTNGQFLVEPKYNFISDFVDGYSYIRDGFYFTQIIDNSGSEVFTYEHPMHYVWDVSDSVILVHDSPGPYFQAVFYLDFEGNKIFQEDFKSGTPFREGYAVVERMSGEVYIVNSKGEFTVNLSEKLGFDFYFETSQFRDGVMAIEGYNKDIGDYRHGYINTQGELIVPLVYFTAYASSDGYLTVQHEDGKMGILDHNHNWVVYPVWERASQVINAMVQVKESENHEWSWYNIENQKIVWEGGLIK